MARFLAIDLEPDRLHVVVGSPGKVEQALTWPLPEELTPASGEALGRALREVLKAAGVSPSPVLACVSRDRLVVKEVRYPPVPRHEEPALIRFQATKELVESTLEVVLDYAVIGAASTGERLAIAWIIKRNVIMAVSALCQGLGVRLQALVPRPLAVAGAWERLAPTAEKGAAAILSGSGGRAELDFIRAGMPIFSRALALGPTLAGDVRRSLGVFASQPAVAEGELPGELIVAGNPQGPVWAEALASGVGVPLRGVNPFLPHDKISGGEHGGVFLAAVGLLHLRGQRGALPINFLAPKEPRPLEDTNKHVKMAGMIGAGVLAVLLIFVGVRTLSGKKAKISELTQARIDSEKQLKSMTQARLDVEGFKEWEDGAVPWLDELYDMAARFPYQQGLRIRELNVEPHAKKGKDKHVAVVHLLGVVPPEKDHLVEEFVEAIKKDTHLNARLVNSKGGNPTSREFKITIEVGRQERKLYTTVLKAPPASKRPAAPPPDPETLADPEGELMPEGVQP